MQLPRVSRRRFLALLATAIGVASAPGVVEAYSVDETVLRLGIGRRIAFLADLHIHAVRHDVARLLASVDPDIVVLGGDTWDEDTPSLAVVEETLRLMKPYVRAGVAVLGNHEHWSRWRHSLDEGVRILEDNGFTVLRDTVDEVGGVVFAGIDWEENPSRYRGVDTRGAEVVVAHSPDAAPYVETRPLLILAGHTHGGQVCLPGQHSIVTNSVYGFYWGSYRVNNTLLYVSRGLGEKLPIRLYCRRQIVIVE